MRIPQAFLDDLLSRTDIVDLIDHCIPLKKTGSNYSACCPFHQEKTPSFSVNARKQFYHCFGCGASGNAISFIMAHDRLDFLDAVEQLAKRAGVDIPREKHTPSPTSLSLYELLDTANAYYQTQLQQHPDALTYLKNRGISAETAKHFGLGYARDAWHQVQSLKHVSVDQWVLSGLMIRNEEGKCYDRFRHRLMFPIRDKRGRVIAFGGRVLDQSTPKYLNSPETPLFHKSDELYGLFEARKANPSLPQLFVVEGYMDVVSLAEHGVTQAVATLGTATTASHIQTLLRHTPRLFFCFDGDNAGRTAAWRALEHALPYLQDGVAIRFMFLPEKEDPDSFVKQHGKEAFYATAEQALSLSDFFFQHLSHALNLSQHEDRARLAEQAKPYLDTLPAGVYKQLMQDELAKRTRSTTTATPLQAPPSLARALPPARHKQPSLLRTAMMLLVQYPSLAVHAHTFTLSTNQPGATLWQRLLSILCEHPQLTTAGLLERVRGSEDETIVMQLANLPHNIPDDGVEAEFLDTLKRMQAQSTEQLIEGLLAKMASGLLSREEKQQLQTLIATRQ